jgi:hypothetical protein
MSLPGADTLRVDEARNPKRGGGSRKRQANPAASKTLGGRARSGFGRDGLKPERGHVREAGRIAGGGKSLKGMKPKGASGNCTG